MKFMFAFASIMKTLALIPHAKIYTAIPFAIYIIIDSWDMKYMNIDTKYR